MGELFYRDKQFIYTEQGKEKVMLDCGNYLSNNSRIPMHCLEHQNIPTLPDILAGLIENGPCGGNDRKLGSALIDVWLAARLIKTSQPVRVLEYGCQGGKISFHLAAVLGEFCEGSSLVCACDTMDMEWMSMISQVEKLPKISFLAGDYGCLQLQQGYFDMVLINGTVNFADPSQVISDSIKLAAEDGMILCYCDDMPLLEDMFQLFFEDEKREDYRISSRSKLMCGKAKESAWRIWEEERDFDGQAGKDLRQAEEMILHGSVEKEKAEKLVKMLMEDAKEAGIKGKVALKLNLLRKKEQLINL